MAIWMDLTNSLSTWRGGVVGIIRTELMLAQKLHEIDLNVKFCICSTLGFKEIKPSELSWLFGASNISDSYASYQRKRADKILKNVKVLNRYLRKTKTIIDRLFSNIGGKEVLSIPFSDGDIVFSCGWFGSNKEEIFSKIKLKLPNLKLVYMIYDIVMLKEGIRHFYYPNDYNFECYLKWISDNCNLVLYCGQTAQKDTEQFFYDRCWRVPPGQWIAFGSDIVRSITVQPIQEVLQKYKIQNSFILAVGSFEPRKNYRVLYQAYSMLALEGFKNIPDLVICGQKFADNDLAEQIQTNPLTKNKIRIFSPSDDELESLYKHCLFAVLPSLYEGRSVVLSEILDHGKLCLCSKVPPLIELGQDLPHYLDPKHPREWCDAIKYFTLNNDARLQIETKVKNNWHPISWKQCAKSVYSNLLRFENEELLSSKEVTESLERQIYIDMSLFFYEGGLSGIPRAQLLLSRFIAKHNANARFFTLHKGRYIELPRIYLKQTFGEGPLDTAVKVDRDVFPQHVILKRSSYPFNKGDVVFSAGVGFSDKVYQDLTKLRASVGFTFVQLIYDFTPILVPHTHSQQTLDSYPKFLQNTYALADYIIYGGETAQKDGETYQKQSMNKVTKSFSIKFGSDIRSFKTYPEKIEKVLSKYGIKGDFLLSVGTIEARKNHELLYEAYLELMRHETAEKLPQLVICGHQGWKTNDFQYRLKVDSRIFGKVILITPHDDELDILYKNCKFTLLPSLYEGWSLTLPESLNYGKFCIAADVQPLHEIGEDIIEYANPYDPVEWAEKMKIYYEHPDKLMAREEMILKRWKNTTWEDCAKNVNDLLIGLK